MIKLLHHQDHGLHMVPQPFVFFLKSAVQGLNVLTSSASSFSLIKAIAFTFLKELRSILDAVIFYLVDRRSLKLAQWLLLECL